MSARFRAVLWAVIVAVGVTLLAASPAEGKRLEGPAVAVDRGDLRIVSVRLVRKAKRRVDRRLDVGLNDGSIYRVRECSTRRCPKAGGLWRGRRGTTPFVHVWPHGKVYWKPRSPGSAFRVLTSNVAATAQCRVDCMAKVNERIASGVVNAVGVQEFCVSRDMAAFRAAHPGWTVAFAPLTREHRRCGRGGQVLAAPGLSNVTRHRLGGDFVTQRGGRKEFWALCGDVPHERSRYRVCTAHLRAGWDAEGFRIRNAQARRLVGATRGSRNLFVVGDVNTGKGPALANRIFADAGLVGTNRQYRATHVSGYQFDRVMYRGPRRVRNARVIPQPSSDHSIVEGWVQ